MANTNDMVSHERSWPIASWVVKEKATGRVVCELYDAALVCNLNFAKYEAIPILEYLYSLNRKCDASLAD